MTPAHRLKQTNVRTPLAEWRVKRGMTQAEVARAAGLSRTVYNQMERGKRKDPSLRALVNLAIVLGCDLDDLLQDEWRRWYKPLPGDPPEPEDPSSLWRS